MVKNVPSRSNLRGSTSTLSLRPSQASITPPTKAIISTPQNPATSPTPSAANPPPTIADLTSPLSASHRDTVRATTTQMQYMKPEVTEDVDGKKEEMKMTYRREDGMMYMRILPQVEMPDTKMEECASYKGKGPNPYCEMGRLGFGGSPPPGAQSYTIPAPQSTLFSNFGTNGVEYTPQRDSEAKTQFSGGFSTTHYQSGPSDIMKSGRDGKQEKTLYEKYNEDLLAAAEKYKDGTKKALKEGNYLEENGILGQKYQAELTEATKRYSDDVKAQYPAVQFERTPITGQSTNPLYQPQLSVQHPQRPPSFTYPQSAYPRPSDPHLPSPSPFYPARQYPSLNVKRKGEEMDTDDEAMADLMHGGLVAGDLANAATPDGFAKDIKTTVGSRIATEFEPLRERLARIQPLQFGDAIGNKAHGTSLITKGLEREMKEQNVLKSPEAYTQPFCDFLTENPTVWHAVQYFEKRLDAAGFKKLSERQTWNSILEKGGKYYISRNGSSLIAFTVGLNYKSGNGVAMIAGHIDALTARLKPMSAKTTKAGYVQLGVAPYAGALNSTWWDRDLGIGGRVLVKDGTTGKIETKLVKLGWPIARIPTLAPHFGVGMTGQNNAETEAVPIVGLDYASPSSTSSEFENLTLGGAGSFAATQPPKLVRAIAGELSIQDYSRIVNWELELFDTQPAQVGGLDKEFIFAGRIDDKLCSWAAMEGLLASASSSATVTGGDGDDGIVKLVGVFDDEEIGSLLRQGARGNFLPSTIERITESFAPSGSANILSQTYANSFMISADVTHAVNPNFLSRYLENHAPRLNVGLVMCADSNGHTTTDSVSSALLTRIAEKSESELQLFMIRNDSRSGGTVGPMLSSAMGVRAIDAGIPQLSMHSIRATTGALDPGLGVKIFKGFFDHFQEIDKEFE